ncbi:hypothetical protein CHU32_03705 [Superficieibacter electus]|uniref:DUF1367 domain-containing protein n=1 Tax=Superficieibacter electus TaxID=2022662 RepID=A0A2P5GVF9_9ENTR|nr:DUF1367 family protein [Superficieibacter electus]POP42350.1 hypothetical protein CHU33_19990 [Superficieibacter electus]POP50539.1 hypothetical protein CHU32_03705 [Superficieibacter electus]
MAQIQLIKITADSLAPANAEAREYLARVKTGVWLNCEIRQQRNYLFHKKLFSLLQLGFEYWTPSGGAITNAEKSYLSGYVRYLIALAGSPELIEETADIYAQRVASRRVNGIALTKSFESYRKWATIEAGFYDEFILPDGTRRREARSISFAKMNEDEFNELYKSVLNVLWNHILFRSFPNEAEADNAVSQLLEYAA